ncbi:hypothetical protein [Stieleria sp.]|uniref:hypothetical protein n=1 Tax=Stieleria sp. TaxID=2795976 RepID=UPI00356AB042
MSQFAKTLTACCFVAGCVASHPVAAQDAKPSSDQSKLRVGTFDSRLVATAYVRSEAFSQRLAKMQADLKNAKASGEEKRVKQLEAEFPALQDVIHKQGFGTWPVHDILQAIKAEIPGIAAKADVEMIVSKWDVVFQRDGIETVDVTDLMVAPFTPDEATRKILDNLRRTEPIPIEKLKTHD